MFGLIIPFCLLRIMTTAEELYYRPYNITRSTPFGIAAYRSALTLDWLAAEDTRQRELVAAFETEPNLPARTIPMDCMAYPRPATGKVARLMLELLKNLEGDDGILIPDLIQALIRSKLLVLETSIFDAEPDLEALVKTPDVMMGEPHATFPRILAMIWMTATDPSSTKRGWCVVEKVTKYLSLTRSSEVAKTMRALDPVLARARFIMEEFIQHVTPLNMLRTSPEPNINKWQKNHLMNGYGEARNRKMKKPMRTEATTHNYVRSQMREGFHPHLRDEMRPPMRDENNVRPRMSDVMRSQIRDDIIRHQVGDDDEEEDGDDDKQRSEMRYEPQRRNQMMDELYREDRENQIRTFDQPQHQTAMFKDYPKPSKTTPAMARTNMDDMFADDVALLSSGCFHKISSFLLPLVWFVL